MEEHDVFAEHVAKLEKHGDHLETLEWKKPGSNTYAIWYVRQYGTLMVYGDCYEAVYQWHWDKDVSLRGMSNNNEDYFISKCRASAHGRDPTVFDTDTLRGRMKEYFADSCTHDKPMCETGFCECCDLRRAEELSFDEYNGWSNMEDEYVWVTWLREHGHDVFGSDWWESIPSGDTLGSCISLHLKGLKRAFEYLEKNSS